MNTLKKLFPFIASIGVYLLALYSPMQRQIIEKHPTDKEIKTIPVEGFEQ